MPGNLVSLLCKTEGAPATAGGPFSDSFAACSRCAVCLAGAQHGGPDEAATTVGSDTCAACHDDIFKAFQKNPHVAVEKDARRGWQGKACESCHGPGSIHAESTDKKDIRNPATAARRPG